MARPAAAQEGLAVDLNVDAGEGLPGEGELLPLCTSVNVACGLHAGDAPTMAATVAAAARLGLAVGAHPSYPDREGFGRRRLQRRPAEVRADVLYQLGALAAVCRPLGVRLHHVKPHGALYHAAWREPAVAAAVAEAVAAFDPGLWIYAPPGSALAAATRSAGLRLAREGFADRGVGADGGLVPRGVPGALLEDPEEAARRALRWVRLGVVAPVGGATELDWPVDTLCVHGDTPAAARLLRAVRGVLEAEGVRLRAP
jgi:UPF0271 protein